MNTQEEMRTGDLVYWGAEAHTLVRWSAEKPQWGYLDNGHTIDPRDYVYMGNRSWERAGFLVRGVN